ncbi:MAG TPA: hypothetical protein PKA14_03295 [Leptospiraceae bacterium]|nr:hypothetical protein [Leptospiraceae bacterium]HNM05416.1 hypothetical protein [Leptospiraceae bacterium]
MNLNEDEIKNIYGREELAAGAERIFNASAEFFLSLKTEEFFKNFNGSWSAEKNLRHLIKSTLPIYLGIKSPKFLLQLLFGKGRAKSRTYSEIREDYLSRLASGSGAGIFEPLFNSAGKPEEQKRLVDDWTELGRNYVTAFKALSEEQLDGLNMPHPILGNITVREMILFSLMHVFHHVKKYIEKTAR